MTVVIPPWLNEKFLEKALKSPENDETISITDTIIRPATGKGDNYLSDMYRVIVEYVRNRGNTKTTEKRSVVIKISITAQDGPKKYVNKLDFKFIIMVFCCLVN